MFIVDDTRCYGVLSHRIPDVWAEVKPLLEKAIAYSDGTFNTEDVYQRLINQEMQLWLVYKDKVGLVCCCVTQINFYPQSKRMSIVFLSSKCFEDVLPFWPLMVEFARSHGCKKVRIEGRDGWVKKLSKLGFRKIHTVMAVEI